MQEKQYRDKLTTAENAVARITSNGNIGFGMAVSQPPALIRAIGERARAGGFEKLKVYYLHAQQPANEHLLRYELMDVIKPCPGFIGHQERVLMEQGDRDGRKVIYYVPNSFSHFPRYFREQIELDTFITTVSPADRFGYFSMGTNNDYGSTAARHCRRLIVEVNENMPRVAGDSLIHISEVSAIVENHVPLPEIVPRAPAREDEIIGRLVAEQIPDGATIQMGVGCVPDAVCTYLEDRKDLGIHSELLSPGMVRLIRRGVVTGRRKNTHSLKHVFTLAMGDKAMYDYMDGNPAMESYPVDYVNNPGVIARNDNVISVNALLEIDLFGQVNAEQLGHRQFGGPGGQNDFVRGAFLSPGGKSILAFESTAKRRTVSKIVPQLQNVVTDLRIDTQYICTEYGMINVKAMSSHERAEKLIALAHPDFRAGLTQAAKDMHLL